MSLRNESGVLNTAGEFHCCCSITRDYFEIYHNLAIPVINCILTVPTSLAATLGNLLVLISIWRTPSLHSPSNFLILSLALSDLGVGLVAQPLFLVLTVSKMQRLAHVFCSSSVAFAVVSHGLCCASFVTLIAISLDRYAALYFPLRYQAIVTVKRVIAIVVTTWITSVPYGISALWSSTFLDYMAIVLISLGLFITTSAYYKIHQVVRHHRAQINQTQTRYQQEGNSLNILQYKKTFVNMLLIYCLFLFCYIPVLLAVAVIFAKGRSVSTMSALEVAVVIMCANSTLNPIVYCWRFKAIRAAVAKTTWDVLCKR